MYSEYHLWVAANTFLTTCSSITACSTKLKWVWSTMLSGSDLAGTDVASFPGCEPGNEASADGYIMDLTCWLNTLPTPPCMFGTWGAALAGYIRTL